MTAFRERRPLIPCLLTLVLLCTAALPSCGGDDESPAGRVLALLDRAERAAEEKDLSSLRGMISEQYRDGSGNDRQALVGLLRYHFLRNESIHLLVRGGDPVFPSPTAAEVTVLVAMAGEPISSAESLSLIRADLYRFDLVLTGGGKEPWLLVAARWRKAAAGDFL